MKYVYTYLGFPRYLTGILIENDISYFPVEKYVNLPGLQWEILTSLFIGTEFSSENSAGNSISILSERCINCVHILGESCNPFKLNGI